MMIRSRLSWWIRKISVVALCMVIAQVAHAETPLLADELPPELEGVGVVERLGDQLPLDLIFTDENGHTVALKDYFQPGRPVILSLNYYRCPMLCGLTLNGLTEGLKELDWTMGQEFQLVTVSINPDEGPDLAMAKKSGYLSLYDRAGADDGWHFLVGEQANIEQLARAVGFGYRYVESTGEYAHTASVTFVTPDGRVSRYINDVVFKPRDLRLALVEASEGTIGSPMDKILLFTCYSYDPQAGSYQASAVKLMRFAGALTVLGILISVVLLLWRGSKTSQRRVAVA